MQPSVKRHAMRPLRWKSSVLISFLLYRTSELVCNGSRVSVCLCDTDAFAATTVWYTHTHTFHSGVLPSYDWEELESCDLFIVILSPTFDTSDCM